MNAVSHAALAFASAMLLMPASPALADELDFSSAIEELRAEHDLPALGGIAVQDGAVQAIGVAGMRVYKGEEPVTIDDKWHIGSCTKSMTATLAATFVEAGDLRWDSTISEVLGDSVKMRKEYEEVTLHQLLSNRSGIPGQANSVVWTKAWFQTGKKDMKNRRKGYAQDILKMKPEFPAGTDYSYSNNGFVVAGLMMETLTGETWETLMQERIFMPLKMGSAGFGSTASPQTQDQPWGHHAGNKPQLPGLAADNPDVIGPAGTVHASLPDLARYVSMHAMQETGPILQKKETFELLHTIAEGNDEYACGWIATERGWAQGEALTHGGSNTMNFCVFWLAPERNFGAIAVSNAGPGAAAKACDEVASALIRKVLP